MRPKHIIQLRSGRIRRKLVEADATFQERLPVVQHFKINGIRIGLVFGIEQVILVKTDITRANIHALVAAGQPLAERDIIAIDAARQAILAAGDIHSTAYQGHIWKQQGDAPYKQIKNNKGNKSQFYKTHAQRLEFWVYSLQFGSLQFGVFSLEFIAWAYSL